MICPQCGTSPSDEMKFCNACGANLHAVRQAITAPANDGEFTFNKTWVADMFLSGPERKLRREEVDRLRGVTAAMKRAKEIKAGVITACSGLGLTIVLLILMQGVIAGTALTPGAAEIVSRLWVVGVIPMLVGIGLIINGLVVSSRLLSGQKADPRSAPMSLGPGARPSLPPSQASASSRTPEFSVTEETTRQLEVPSPKQ